MTRRLLLLLFGVGLLSLLGSPVAHADVWANVKDGTPVATRPLFLGNGAIREGDWKLLDGKLYDVVKDPAEKSDVAADHPDVVRSLSAKLEEWHAKLNDAAPKKRKNNAARPQ
jgi:hypothetical protein